MTIISDSLTPPEVPNFKTLVAELKGLSEAAFEERDLASRSLLCILQYFNGQGLGTDLLHPLWALVLELHDLDEGKVGPITRPVDRRKPPTSALPSRAISLALVEHFRDYRGMTPEGAIAKLHEGGGPAWTRGDFDSWRGQSGARRPDYEQGEKPDIGFDFETYDHAVAVLAEDPDQEQELLCRLRELDFAQKKRISRSRSKRREKPRAR